MTKDELLKKFILLLNSQNIELPLSKCNEAVELFQEYAKLKPTEEKEKTFVEKCSEKWILKYKEIMDQREEILFAFVAKYGCGPDELIQIEQRMNDGSTKWYLTTDDHTKSSIAYNKGFTDGYLKAQPQWQPIETAPKNGIPILAKGKYSSVCAFWNKDHEMWLCHEYPDSYNTYEIQPTHWMPLPKLPKQEK